MDSKAVTAIAILKLIYAFFVGAGVVSIWITEWDKEELAKYTNDFLMLMTMISCGLGVNASNWARRNIAPFFI